MGFVLRSPRARVAAVCSIAVALLATGLAPEAGAHQWHRVHGTTILTVADADAHLWRVRLKVERTRSGTASITTSCLVQIPYRGHEVAGFGKTVTIAEGEPSVNVLLGRLSRNPRREPPDPDAVEIAEAKHCHRLTQPPGP